MEKEPKNKVEYITKVVLTAGAFALFIYTIVFNQLLDSSSVNKVFKGLSSTPNRENYKGLDWEMMYKLDYKTWKMPDELKKFDGQKVKIAGFIVPLSDNYATLDEFLLVPDAQSCVHVPPPPPNLMVIVKMKKTPTTRDIPFPAWVYGDLKIAKKENKFGVAAYQLSGDSFEKYYRPGYKGGEDDES